jgi:hypothetical protein
MRAKRKAPATAPILRPFRTEYGAGLFPGNAKTLEGAMKAMWGMVVERREYNGGVCWNRETKAEEGRIRQTAGGWLIQCPRLMRGRKIVRSVK